MEATSVTSKGRIPIPKEVRQQLGIRQGSRVEFSLLGDHVEMRVKSSPTGLPDSGFGMLKSRRTAVPADFDPATLPPERTQEFHDRLLGASAPTNDEKGRCTDPRARAFQAVDSAAGTR